MSLSGNLGFVSIDEVLRLLNRSAQSGSVEVQGPGFSARVFVETGGVSLATTTDDESLRRHLIQAGLVDEIYLRSIEGGSKAMQSLADKAGDDLSELLREMTVESLYQITRHGLEFEVFEGRETPYASPTPYDLEPLLSDAADRAAEWETVSRAVPDLAVKFAFQRDLGDRDQVTIAADAWKVLSEIGRGSSVTEIAERLGTTEFWTARVTGHLLGDSLVSTPDLHASPQPLSQPESTDESGIGWDEAAWQQKSDEWSADMAEPEEPQTLQAQAETVSEPLAEPVAETADHAKSWWAEPAVEDAPAERVEEPTESVFGRFAAGITEADLEDTAEMPTVPPNSDAAIEDDTEAFLEKVFSELESPSPQEESENGYGLLRRRRMSPQPDTPADA